MKNKRKNQEAYALSDSELTSVFDSAEPAPKRAKKGIYLRVLLIWCAAILLAGAAGCVVLYRYLDAYEAALPEHVMDALLLNTPPEEWQERVRKGIARDVSEFDDGEAIFSGYAEALLGEGEYAYRRDAQRSEADAPVYTVSLAGLDLCRVTLAPDPESRLGFGRHYWLVEAVEPCPALGNLTGVTVEIDAPPGEAVYLNGRMIGAEYITDDALPCPNAPAIEERFSDPARYVRYRVDALYGDVRVTDKTGLEYAPTVSENDVVRYVLPGSMTYSVTVQAPSDVTVTLCGAELTAEDATLVNAGILKGLESYTGEAAYETYTYAFSGLYTEPAVTARDASGQELAPLLGENGKITFFHVQDENLYTSQRDTVRAFFNAYVNYSADPFFGDLSVTKEMLDDPEEEIPDQVAESMRRYYRLLDRVQWGSELYQYIVNSTDAMVWASHTRVNYNELTFTDFSYVGEDCFVCTVRYQADFAASAWYESYTYDMQNAYEIAFVRAPWGSWYAAAMAEISG